MENLFVSRKVSAPQSIVWEFVSDVGGYSQYAPNIDSSQIISGSEQGMIRECTNADGSWQETCTHWNPGQSYAFSVYTKAANYPYPLTDLNAVWKVIPTNDQTSTIHMDFEFQFIEDFPESEATRLKEQFQQICEVLLDNWESSIQEKMNA